MGSKHRGHRRRAVVDVVTFLVVVAVGLLLIIHDHLSSDGLDAAAYLTSVYGAWRAEGSVRRSVIDRSIGGPADR